MSPARRAFLRQFSLVSIGLCTSSRPLWAETETASSQAKRSLPRSLPEVQGVSSEGILAFLNAVEEKDFELHSFMMVRHGHVVAEGWWAPYGPEYIHTMYSMSKSFTSTAVGLAMAEDRLTVEDKVISFFPDDLPSEISENLAALRVKDLLCMAVGNEKDPTQPVVKEENWVRTFLSQPIVHKPGTKFLYNSAATYMCSAIVQKLTGQKMLDYLTPRLFEPLGITGMTWETCPRGINTGGWGLSVQTEALAKFGQLFLQKGRWNGKQILPAAWVEEATSRHIQQPGGDKPGRPKAENDWLQGYGYQFWRCQHGHYRGDGAFGQFTLVLPEHDAVIVMTGENKNMQGQLDLVWQHLLPAFTAKAGPAAEAAKLTAALAALKLPLPEGQVTAAAVERIGGKTYQLEENRLGITQVSFAFHGGTAEFTARTAAGTHGIRCGVGHWQNGGTDMPGTPPRLISGGKPKIQPRSKVAAHAAWLDDHTLVMTWRYYETPHRDTVTCRFDGDRVSIRFLSSIAAMNDKPSDPRPELAGRMAS